MKAMAIERFGDVSELKQTDLPDPEPAPRDVIIDVHACAMNPVDYKIREGAFPMPGEFPRVLGYDVSGVVVDTGPDVRRFSAGDEVYASPALIRNGANAERVAVDERLCAKKPESLTHSQAAALPLVTLTAWEALHDHLRIAPRQTLLIHGGAGGVGHVAVQLAQAHDCRVIATASRPESIQLCRNMGADEVVNYREENVPQRVRELTDDKGVEIVFDTVSVAETFHSSCEALTVGGDIAMILPPAADFDFTTLFTKNGTLHCEFMGGAALFGVGMEHQGHLLEEAALLADDGKLAPHISQTLSLDQLADAHTQQATGHTLGKIVLAV